MRSDIEIARSARGGHGAGRGVFVRLLARLVLLGAAAAAVAAEEPAPALPAALAGLPGYATAFDATRDPVADMKLALTRAQDANRRVLVIVGGDWCVWCFLLDRHFRDDAAAAHTFYTGFEVMRVYYGDDNTNQAFLAAMPAFDLFPHFFVVGNDGRVLASVDADVLIANARYDNALIAEFVRRWTPPAR